jgi:hypothetical protein
MTNYLLLFLILSGIATPFIVQGLKHWSRAANIAALILTLLVSLAAAAIVMTLAAGARFVWSLDLILSTSVVFAFATVTFKVLKDGLGTFNPPSSR